MEPKKVSNGLALRKVAALTKGDLKEEDCVMISFLVGTEDSVAEEIRACKFDLVVASEYFQSHLMSHLTPDGPIRIKHVDPEIFRLVVEFTHLSGHLVSEVNDLEQCLKLAAAADEFLLNDLGLLCTEKLEKMINVYNVWPVLNQYHAIKYTSAVCEKLLSYKTEECLLHPAFLEIDENAWTKFLKLKKMNISSETQLVTACLQFVRGKEDKRALFRRCALPHLRLLTLSADGLFRLAPFLENEEKMFLSLKFLQQDPLLIQGASLDTKSLCKEAEPRQPFLSAALEGKLQKRVDFVPEELLGLGSKICQDDYHLVSKCAKFALIIEAHEFIKITGFDVLGLIDYESELKEGSLISRMDNVDGVNRMFGSLAKVTVTGFQSTSVDLKPTHLTGLWAHFETSIFVVKGEKVHVEVFFDGNCCMRKVSAKEIGGPEVTCSFKQINPSFLTTSEWKSTIFKSLYYKNVL